MNRLQQTTAALDAEAIRAGRHCCHPLFNALGLEAILRASFHVYNTEEDVDRLVAGVEKARRILGSRVASPVSTRSGDPCARRLSA